MQKSHQQLETGGQKIQATWTKFCRIIGQTSLPFTSNRDFLLVYRLVVSTPSTLELNFWSVPSMINMSRGLARLGGFGTRVARQNGVPKLGMEPSSVAFSARVRTGCVRMRGQPRQRRRACDLFARTGCFRKRWCLTYRMSTNRVGQNQSPKAISSLSFLLSLPCSASPLFAPTG